METTHSTLNTPALDFDELTHVDSIDRWDIYYRLLELSIPCSCAMGKPLRVSVQNPCMAIQLWSVVKQVTTSRREKVQWLNACWEL